MILIAILAGLIIILGFTAFFGAPYVPSHKIELQRAFRTLRPLNKHDVMIDLGCGDGIVLRTAISAGAGKAIGIELNPILAVVARLLSRYSPAVEIHIGNMWTIDPPQDLTVVYVFGVGRDMKKLEVMLQAWSRDLGRPIELVLYGHTLPGRKPARTAGAHHLYHF